MKPIEWTEPPADRRGGSRPSTEWDRIAAELRNHPGEWAKVQTAANPGAAYAIKNGGLKSFEPAGTFEAVSRSAGKLRGKTVVDTYARYVGPVDE